MTRQRRKAPSDEESSSDEEDAFSKLAQKNKKKKKDSSSSSSNSTRDANAAASSCPTETDVGKKAAAAAASPAKLPVSVTSSNKRHHVAGSDSRKAKMDALLLELEQEKAKRPVLIPDNHRNFVPEKKGSFVDPSEEHLTTNIFVGNLSPSLTEEEVTDVFRQFGDLFSVKIMWPRSEEERRRNRNTGFVCFMKREDAEEAMLMDESDPFGVGRRIMLRWGKNVKKIITRGTGGVAIAPIRKRSASTIQEEGARNDESKRARTESTDGATEQTTHAGTNFVDPFSSVPVYDQQKHESGAIRVQVPSSPARAQFISTVASFVAKDGTALENKLMQLEANNPDFAFLSVPPQPADHSPPNIVDDRDKMFAEHIFYRWRTFAFCQGDSFNLWRTEPFMMVRGGNFWIPPALDAHAARQEELEQKMRENVIEQQKKERRRRVLTGRQLEQARRGGLAGAAEGGAQLTREEIAQFNLLFREKLCASREAICEAMAFCYQKSGAAKQIARMLKESLLEDDKSHPEISLETRIARLYVLSDVLFNSQQPGVRNAFLYRNSVEEMAPEVFTSLGKHGSGTLGRMTRNKLTTAVSAVLAAWTNWSVYNPVFLDELHARFEGREIRTEVEDIDTHEEAEDTPEKVDVNANAVKVITEQQRQDWTTIEHNEEKQEIVTASEAAGRPKEDPKLNEEEKSDFAAADSKADNNENSDDYIDGEALNDDDLDGEELDDEDLDGEALDEDDLDGEALQERNV